MGQGLLRMVAMSFFLSSTCSKIRASSSSDRDAPPEVLEATEVDLKESQGVVEKSEKEASGERGPAQISTGRWAMLPILTALTTPHRPAPAQKSSLMPLPVKGGHNSVL